MTKEDVAQVLKRTRIAARLTQQQAADLLGRKQQTLASWETGQSQPDANTLFRLFDIYGVSVDEAFGIKKKTAPAFPSDALRVAEAYINADVSIQLSVRKLLDIPDEATESKDSKFSVG